MKHHQHWIVTADGRSAALFECQRTPAGALHLGRCKSIENAHEAEHERGRPTLAGGAERRGSVARSGARAAPHAVAVGHEHEEEQRRFAREIRSWLAHARRISGDQRVTLFAPARFLGLLRAEFAKDDMTVLREAELTHLGPNELAVHPAILSAISGS